MVHVERIYPYIGGLVFSVLAGVYSQSIYKYATENAIEIERLFPPIFDIASILTGLLFSVFTVAIAPSSSFINSIIETSTFKVFKRYIVEALLCGAILVIISIPFMVTNIEPKSVINIILIVVWSFFVMTSVLAFFRVFHIFIIMLNVKRQV